MVLLMQMIIDRKTRLEDDTILKEYTRIGLRFENDSTLGADAVVFATGHGDYRGGSRKLPSKELGSKVKQFGLWMVPES